MAGFDPRQLQDMMSSAKQQYEKMQEKLQQTIVGGSAGGGAVTVRMNGMKQVLDVKLDPECVKSGDIEMLQDLIVAAINEAGRNVDQEVQSGVGNVLGGLNLGSLGNLFG